MSQSLSAEQEARARAVEIKFGYTSIIINGALIGNRSVNASNIWYDDELDDITQYILSGNKPEMVAK